MTGITSASEKRLIVASGRAHPELAREIVDVLGVDVVPMDAYDFANGEIYVRFGESVRGCDAFVIQSHSAPINQWLMEQLIMVDALKRASAKRITVIRLAEARLSASTMIRCSISHWLIGAQWLWMTNASQPRTLSPNRT